MSESRFAVNADVAALLPWSDLIEAIEQVVVHPDGDAPPRTVHRVPRGDRAEGVFLMKPGWVAGDVIAIKAVTFFADNGSLGLPTVQSGVMLFDAVTGSLLGACDGDELTARRTAAASVVAAKRLARADARSLLIVGTGAVAECLAHAYAEIRDLETINVWGRNPDKADKLAARLRDELAPITVNAVAGLADAVPTADIITCATPSTEALIEGALVAPGTHVDLIGAFDASMRETDDEVMRRATIFVDTRADAMIAGDIALPLAAGVIDESAVVADLRELVDGSHPGRRTGDEITVFKSAGMALEDVAAARLVFRDLIDLREPALPASKTGDHHG